MIEQRLEQVRLRIQRAAESSGRNPANIELVAVTKTFPAEVVQEASQAGLAEIGENKVQEAQTKQQAIQADVRWHLLGHLQKNKAKVAAEIFDVIHSVDSVELAETLEAKAEEVREGQPLLQVYIQVNVSGETSKSGCRPSQVDVLVETIRNCEHLELVGLMTIPPWSEDPEDARMYFQFLRRIRDELEAQLETGPLGLSMGMSHDFEVAIEEGATCIRVGTALMGKRDV